MCFLLPQHRRFILFNHSCGISCVYSLNQIQIPFSFTWNKNPWVFTPPVSLLLCWFFPTTISVLFFLCAGGPPIPWHLSLHDGPRGDWGSGEDVPGHCQAPAWQLWFHGSDPDVCVPSPGAAAQGLPARSQGKGSSNHVGEMEFGSHIVVVCTLTAVLSCVSVPLSLFLASLLV